MSKSDSEAAQRSLPGISLVVPVRDEEMSIGESIASIVRVHGPRVTAVQMRTSVAT